jgi:hypothetical protein
VLPGEIGRTEPPFFIGTRKTPLQSVVQAIGDRCVFSAFESLSQQSLRSDSGQEFCGGCIFRCRVRQVLEDAPSGSVSKGTECRSNVPRASPRSGLPACMAMGTRSRLVGLQLQADSHPGARGSERSIFGGASTLRGPCCVFKAPGGRKTAGQDDGNQACDRTWRFLAQTKDFAICAA